MKVRTTIFLLKDSFGTIDSVTVEDTTCNASTSCELRNEKGERTCFDSEAFHLQNFCEENQIELKIIKREEDFDTLWNS